MYHYRHRPNRVFKPSSAGNSPHNAQTIGRRRTTAAHWLSRQKSILGQGVMNMTNAMASRPISWHPSSQHSFQTNPSVQSYEHSYPQTNMYNAPGYITTEMHGLVTPMSYPFPGEPFQSDTFPFLDAPQQDYCTPQEEVARHLQVGPAQSLPWSSQTCGINYATSQEGYPQSRNGCLTFQNQPQVTAPPTPDFLPIQNFPSPEPVEDASSSSFLLGSKPSGTELVGMGLYDLPSSTQRTKSLILEETFVPKEDEDEEDGEENEEEGMEEQEESKSQMDETEKPTQILNCENQPSNRGTSTIPMDAPVLQSNLQGPFDPFSQYFAELSLPGSTQRPQYGWV
ncbi:MAG: hypothetical protein Q9227_005549 [Pyrenula ochraceoflavens]